MDSDFFGESTEPNSQPTYNNNSNFQANQNNEQEEFDFGGVNNYASSSNQNIQYTAQQNDETAKKIREEEEKIQQRLRQKANNEYQQKNKRKEAGRIQLQEFLHKKQDETAERKRQNVEKQKRLIAQNKKLTEEAGWKKVAANVALKQGESKVKKDVNRMREAIINKRNDQTS